VINAAASTTAPPSAATTAGRRGDKRASKRPSPGSGATRIAPLRSSTASNGVEIAFVTRESSRLVERRAEKLKVRYCYLGVGDKKAALPRLLEDTGIEIAELAYIGDDVNDAGIMSAVANSGLVGAPLDAVRTVLHSAHYRCARPGGYGAFRDFAEWILGLRAQARTPKAIDNRDYQWGDSP